MSNFIDLTGQRFGKLTIIEQSKNDKGTGAFWKCLCDCGNETIVVGSHLRSGDTSSCGKCKKEIKQKNRIKDFTGLKFGWIEVIEKVGQNDKKQYLYLCKCQCGNEFIKASSEIRRLTCCYNCRNRKRSLDANQKYIGKKFSRLIILNIYFDDNKPDCMANAQCECGNIINIPFTRIKNNSTKSCGCAKIGCNIGKFTTEERHSSFQQLYKGYKYSAKQRNLSFNLSENDFRDITSSDCYYCGKEPNQIKNKNVNGYYVYNGIDRIDSSMGYELSNVVSCCKECNFGKRDYSKQKFLSWVEKVYNHSIKDKENNNE